MQRFIYTSLICAWMVAVTAPAFALNASTTGQPRLVDTQNTVNKLDDRFKNSRQDTINKLNN